MLRFLRTYPLTSSLFGIPLAEIIAHIPSPDVLTLWLKLLIQFLLLLTVIYQLRNTVRDRQHKRSDPDQ